MKQKGKIEFPGFVYVIESLDGSTVKIGRTTKPNQRIKNLQSKPQATGRVYISTCQPHHSWIEKECHENFSEYRIYGEWFVLKFEKAVNYLKSILEPEITKEDADLQQNNRRKTQTEIADAAVDKFLDKFYPKKEKNMVEKSQINLSIAETMRNAILVEENFYCESLVRNDRLYGLSEFEFLMYYELETLDKYCIAQLMHEAVACSKDKDRYGRFLKDVRSSVISTMSIE